MGKITENVGSEYVYAAVEDQMSKMAQDRTVRRASEAKSWSEMYELNSDKHSLESTFSAADYLIHRTRLWRCNLLPYSDGASGRDSKIICGR